MRSRKKLDKRWRSRADSSMFLATVLWCIDRMRRPLTWAGVDFDVLREVLRTKFMLELRSGGSGLVPGGAGMDIALVMTVLAFAGLGMLAGVGGLLLEGQPWLWSAGTLTALMGLLGMVLLMHYVTILVDTTDIEVIMPQPVRDATLFAARLMHLLLYAGLLASTFTGCAMFLAVFRQPPLAVLLVFPVAAVLSTLFTVGFIALLFTSLLRLVGPARFQRLALWFQIGVTALAMGGSQLVRHIPYAEEVAMLFSENEVLCLLLPPFHFAGLFMLGTGDFRTLYLVCAGLALGLPALALFVTLRLASRHFIAGLGNRVEFGTTSKRGYRRGILTRLGHFFTPNSGQRAGFDFATAVALREQMFLRLVVPQTVGFQVLAIGMVINLRSLHGGAASLAIPFALSFLLMVLPQVFAGASLSTNGDARWLLAVSPRKNLDDLLQGAVKGLLGIGLAIPALVSSAVLLIIFGLHRLPDLILALELVTLAALVFTPKLAVVMPFTVTVGASARSLQRAQPSIGVVFALLFVMAAIVGIQALLTLHPVSTAIAILAMVPLLIKSYRALRNIRIRATVRA